ncbi:unnamed protein product, partial [Didymodactylos carnosus]
MTKVVPEVIMNPADLSDTTSLPSVTEVPPRELPKHLADFKQYVDSKWCYFSTPVMQAEMIDVQSKVAYQCHMKILMEGRHVWWKEKPHPWGNETLLGSTTLGQGKIRCSSCKAQGGFLHLPTLTVKWHTRKSTWYCQNSYLPEKRIRKGRRTVFWSTKIVPWSEGSIMANTVESIIENTPGIDLKMSVIKHYNEKHLNPTRSKNIVMRRMECSIERMDFEEIHYTMGENYLNKKDPTR